MSQVQADRQATSLSRQSTSSIAPVDRPSQFIPHLPAPPTPPSVKRLDLVERNAVKREYEKSMYKYMAQHGTLSTTEICGPCERNHTPCIRLPAMKKCALCFRGHDVCEMWDETVTNAGRRRTNHPKNQKKEHKKDNKVYSIQSERREVNNCRRMPIALKMLRSAWISGHFTLNRQRRYYIRENLKDRRR